MNRKDLFALAEGIISKRPISSEGLQALTEIPDQDALMLLPGADMIREYHFGRDIKLCMIINAKSGRCTEDCGFCAQSAFAHTEAPVYPLVAEDRILEGGRYAEENPVSRYSVVTSGKGISKKELVVITQALRRLDTNRIDTCSSLGILEPEDLRTLKQAGVSRYHHNLETARSHFPWICSTHTYEERVNTILAAKEAGFSVCVGGVFGIGETDQQVLELAVTLRDLEVDAVPINFLVPIKGTPLENQRGLTPRRCLKIISLFRYVLPDKDIIVCGGRETNLGELHPLIFLAGANGVMTGDYLTTPGRSLENDLELISQLGLRVST